MFGLKKLLSRQSSQQASDVSESVQFNSGEGSVEAADNEENAPTNSRRSFLLKCGKYSAYTAPVIYTLLAPKGSIYAQSGASTST